MKIFKTLLVLSIFSASIHAETLDEALNKTRARFAVKEAKKQKRDEIKASHKAQVEALKAQIKSIRDEQKQELKALTPHKGAN